MSETVTRVLYNHDCPVCRAEITHYADYAGREGLAIGFYDLNMVDLGMWGVTADQAARRLHVVHEGRVLSGIPAFITQLTGITNAMIADAPPAEAVMAEAARFVGDTPLVAHNAGFDQRYWRAELARAGVPAQHPFACTVLLSRRLYPEVPSHKLGTLVDWFQLPRTGQAHRALADAEMATELLARIQRDLRERHGVADPHHGFLMTLQRCARKALPKLLGPRANAQPGFT